MTKNIKGRRSITNFPSLEVEATLIICSDNPQQIVKEIADLASIGVFRLLPETNQEIHDLYFDTSDRALRAKKMALRVRVMEINGINKNLLTIKGPSRPINGVNEVERLEIECEWSEGSKDGIDRVFKKLQDQGIRLNQPRQVLDYLDPIVTLKTMGFEIIQNRKTSRTVRNVVLKEKELSAVVAELAIDEGAYQILSQDIRYSEIEIEAKMMDSSAVLNALVEKLLEKFGNKIHKWNYSKLAMGMAIEKLIAEKGIKDLIDTDGNLTPRGYKMIKNYLEKNSWL